MIHILPDNFSITIKCLLKFNLTSAPCNCYEVVKDLYEVSFSRNSGSVLHGVKIWSKYLKSILILAVRLGANLKKMYQVTM